MQQTIGETARQLFVPEHLDKPEISPARRWSGVLLGLVLYAAFSLLFSTYLHVGAIVSILLGFPAIVMMAVIAYRHRGTRRARPALFVLIFIGFFTVGIPAISLFSNPQPALDRLYALTGIKPGPDDAMAMQVVFMIFVFASLFSLIAYWIKLRRQARKDASSLQPNQQNRPMSSRQAWTFVAFVATAVLIMGAAIHFRSAAPKAITYPLYGDTGFVAGPNGPAMGPALIKKLAIPSAQVAAANRIFQDYYDKFIALERRHTKHTRDEQGHVHVITQPFVDEMHALAMDLQAELGGVVDQRIAPKPPEKGKVHSALPYFRQAGEATVTADLWKNEQGVYLLKQDVRWINGNSVSFSSTGGDASSFPEQYRLYWSEPEASHPEPTTQTASKNAVPQ